MATPAQVTSCKEAIYNQLLEAGRNVTLRGFADIYYGILLTLADHGSSKRLSAHPDVVLTVECEEASPPARGKGKDIAEAELSTEFEARLVRKTVTYQMAKLSDAVLMAGIKSVRRFARAEANTIYELVKLRGFTGVQTQWHIKSNMPKDLWQWAFDVADYVTSVTPDERERVAIAASRQAIRATEEIVNYGTQTTFKSGQ